jgi:hypothetical protein
LNYAAEVIGWRPDFDALDTGKKGYLTARDVKSQQWLSKHFTKCNLNHDGHLTQDEYANCQVKLDVFALSTLAPEPVHFVDGKWYGRLPLQS